MWLIYTTGTITTLGYTEDLYYEIKPTSESADGSFIIFKVATTRKYQDGFVSDSLFCKRFVKNIDRNKFLDSLKEGTHVFINGFLELYVKDGKTRYSVNCNIVDFIELQKKEESRFN